MENIKIKLTRDKYNFRFKQYEGTYFHGEVKDKNKVKEAGLTPITTPSGSKAFSEAWMIIECRKMVSQTINIDGIADPELRKQWAGKAMHKMFIGEILNVWVK